MGALYRKAAQLPRLLLKTGVAVEKLRFALTWPKFRGYKNVQKSRTSFVGHPSANLFLKISA
jgi:hypothetical protein